MTLTLTVCEKLIQLLSEYDLIQVHPEQTKEDRILDLHCTNKPGILLVKSTETILWITNHVLAE